MGRKSKKKNKKAYNPSREDGDRISRFSMTDLVYILLIAGLVMLFFLPAVVSGKVFFSGDVMNVYNPYQAINAEQLAQGKMPLWTDRFFCGFPLFAESQGAVFYPPTRLAYALAPVHHAFTLDALFHFFLAGFFMYILARYLKQSPLAAFLAATAFAFSGLFCTLIFNFTIFRSAVWIPIIFYLTRRVLLERGLKWTLFLSLAFVCQMMGGSLQVTAITGLLLFIDTVYVVITSLTQKAFIISAMRVLKVVLGLLLAVGLYAFQLMPTWELTNLTQRGVEPGLEYAGSYSFPAQHLVDIAMPNYFGNPANATILPGIDSAPNYFGYIGVIALGLALYALGSRRSGIFWPISIVFVILSLGPAGGLFNLVYWTVPLFDKFRGPARFLIVFIFATALLAGFGADRLISRDGENGSGKVKKKKKKNNGGSLARRVHLLVLMLLLVVVIIGILPWLGGAGKTLFDGIMRGTIAGPLGITIDESNFGQYEKWRAAFPHVVLYFAVFAALIPIANLLFGSRAGGRGLVVLFVIFNCLDLFVMSVTNHGNNLIDGKFFAEEPKSVQVVKQEIAKKEIPFGRIYSFNEEDYLLRLAGVETSDNGGLSTVERERLRTWYEGAGGGKEDYFKLREILAPNLGAYFGLYDANGFASLFTEDFYMFEGEVSRQLSYIASGNPVSSHLTNGSPRHLLLDTMAADYIITGTPLPVGERFEEIHNGDVLIYRNKMALPRAYVVHPSHIEEVDNSDLVQLAAVASKLDGFDFEKNIILQPSSGAPYVPDGQAGISTDIVPLAIPEPDRIRAKVTINRPGVFVLADSFYPGWHAKVNKKEVKILRANLYYRGIILNEPGTYEIEFYFAPKSFDTGKLFSMLAFVLFVLFAIGKGVIDRWYRRPAEEEEYDEGPVKVVRHGLFGKRVIYDDDYDEDEDDEY